MLIISGLIKLRGKDKKNVMTRTPVTSVAGNYDPVTLLSVRVTKGSNYWAVNKVI